MDEESLAQQFANKRYVGWTPQSDEWLHALAVIGNDKPAALVTVFEDEMDRVRQLQELARSHGCKTLICCSPELVSSGDSPSHLSYSKDMLLYRDDQVRDDYVRLMQDWYAGRVAGNDYSRRKGEIMGYGKDAIDAYIREHPLAEGANGSSVLAHIQQETPIAVYEQLAADPVLGALLPARIVSQRQLD